MADGSSPATNVVSAGKTKFAQRPGLSTTVLRQSGSLRSSIAGVHLRYGNSREGSVSMKCPDCGRYMDLEEKDTSSGRDMRTYYCPSCKKRVDVDNGIALWKVLSDAREKE